MQITDIEKIKPAANKVVVEIIPNTAEDVEISSNLESAGIETLKLYKGKIISYGVNAKENAELLKKNKIGLFTEFAGYHLPVIDKLVKIIDSYDIMAFNKGMKIDNKSVTPSHNRVLVEVLSDAEETDGAIINVADSREVLLKYAKILDVGTSCTLGYKSGDIIGFEAYAGEIVRPELSDDEPELIVIMEDLLLFRVQK